MAKQGPGLSDHKQHSLPKEWTWGLNTLGSCRWTPSGTRQTIPLTGNTHQGRKLLKKRGTEPHIPIPLFYFRSRTSTIYTLCTKEKLHLVAICNFVAGATKSCTWITLTGTQTARKHNEHKRLEHSGSLCWQTTDKQMQMLLMWWGNEDGESAGALDQEHANLPHSHHLHLCFVLRRVLLHHQRKQSYWCQGFLSDSNQPTNNQRNIQLPNCTE